MYMGYGCWKQAAHLRRSNSIYPALPANDTKRDSCLLHVSCWCSYYFIRQTAQHDNFILKSREIDISDSPKLRWLKNVMAKNMLEFLKKIKIFRNVDK